MGMKVGFRTFRGVQFVWLLRLVPLGITGSGTEADIIALKLDDMGSIDPPRRRIDCP